MIFAALIPHLLKAIMGSGAVAIPAMTAAQGAAGAAGGTAGGAAATAAAAGPGADMADAGGRISPLVGSGGGGGGNPLQIGPGGKFGGTDGGSRPFPGGSQYSGVPDDWLPYQVPKTGFGRFAQRLGGEDPAARNAEFLANKQRFGMDTAVKMEEQARREQGMWNRQKDEQGFQAGQNKEDREARERMLRESRGFQSQHDWNIAQWRAQNEERLKKLDTMESRADKYYSYDPIVQEDTARQMRDAQLNRMTAPIGLGGGTFYDPDYNQFGMVTDPTKPSVSIGPNDPRTGEATIINIPGQPGSIRFWPRGGEVESNVGAPMTPGAPTVNPNNLDFITPPMGATATQPTSAGGFMETLGRWLRTQGGSRPGMYPNSPR